MKDEVEQLTSGAEKNLKGVNMLTEKQEKLYDVLMDGLEKALKADPTVDVITFQTVPALAKIILDLLIQQESLLTRK